MVASRFELLAGLRSGARAAGAMTVVIAGLVITGWRFDIALLKTLLPGLPVMVVNIAVTFLLGGVALWLRAGERDQTWRRGAGQACALLVLAIGVMLMAWPRLVPPSSVSGAGDALSAGPPADVGLGFIFVGLALLLLERESRGGYRPSQWLALAAGAVSLVALAGYSYGAPNFHSPAPAAPYPGMAPHAAVAFLVLATGILCVHPDRGLMRVVTSAGPGGVVARRLLPAALFLPLILGALRLEGQRAGLYDLGMGLALFAVANVFTSAGLVWWIATLLRRTDDDRRQAGKAREELLLREAQRSEQLKLAVREAHHRIKNNLQAISDLLSLAASSGDTTPAELLRDSIHRVRAIALVHDLLCHDNDIRTVDARAMAERLVPAVLANSGPPREIDLDLQVPSVPLSSKMGTDLALILNELVTNAAKHAFGGRRTGRLVVSLRPIDDGLRLRVRDDGPGLPSGFDPAVDAQMGLTVVQTLSERDLKGTLTLTSDRGLVADVWFPW